MKIEIFDYGMNGEGVAKVDGKVLLIEQTLPNETVDCEIVEDKGNFAFAKVNTVITPSKNRTIPPCPYFDECGGCDLQHMNYEEQLKFKSALVKKTLRKIADIDAEVLNTIASDKSYNYRNKVSFNLVNGEVGFFKKNSKNIIKISKCFIISDNFNRILNIFTNFLNNFKNKNEIKNLVIREINNQILVGIVTKKEINLIEFWNILSKEFSSIGLYQIINKRKDSVVLSGQVKHVDGIKEINVDNFELNYSVDLMGFHQTNEFIQNKIYNKVLEYISPNSIVVNGFSGQGLLTAIISKKAKHVYGIEINSSSHNSAEKLKKDNKITNITNILGDFYKQFDKIKEKIDTIILDPAKKGCGKDTICAIIGVKNIIYISCNPIALAKDLRELKDYYEIENVVSFDMFPNTKNVETLVKLKLKEK